MKTVKRLVIVLLFVALAVCATGCIRSTGSYRVTKCYSKQTTDSFFMEYENFNGNKAYTFTAKQGAELGCRFVTESGKLDCRITDKSGKEYYNESDVPTSEFSVTLDGDGEYTVSLNASDHSGAFYFKIKK